MVHFIDGSKISISFPQQIKDPAMMASRVQKALQANELAFEADGDLIVIPTANIKYLQVHPAPEKLPEMVVQGARLEFD
jgi:hypothetical protein